jgi:raffinose/stachyose/melibiose transport system substrate-binding protein
MPCAVGVVLAVGVLVFAAGAAAAGRDLTTVTLVDSTAATDGAATVVANFERAYPNVVINVVAESSAAELAELQAGTAPDILQVGAGPGVAGQPGVWPLGPQYFADLSGEPWVKQLWPSLVGVMSAGGKVYAEPTVNSVFGMVYNKDLFARLGLTPPTSWSALLADCGRIADQGIVPIEFDGANATSVGDISNALAANSVFPSYPNWSSARQAGKVTFDGTPGWRQALQSFLDLQNARCFEPSPTTVSAAAATGVFESGGAAMMIRGTSTIGASIATTPGLNWGLFPLPAASGKPLRVVINPLHALAVNAASPVKQQAIEFLDFVGRAWQSVALASANYSISALDAWKGVAPSYLSLFAPAFKAHRVYVAPSAWANNLNGVAVLRADIVSMLTDTKTIDQVLTDADAAW